MLRRFTAFFGAAVFLVPFAFAQEEVTLEPSRDNTLYESSDGSVSNGSGEFLFVGRTGTTDNNRRGVIAFDLEGSVPSGATIQEVVLSVHVSKIPPGVGETPIAVHRLTADWGEGASDASGVEGVPAASASGDATWIHRFYDTDPWANPGGDFESAPSATFSVSGLGDFEATSEAMADDVRAWLSDPASNFGWILIGDESTNHTARRLDSRENSSAANRPQLTITYMGGTASERSDLPTTLRLAGNYPNPFTKTTTIHYEVEQAQDVSLTLYDVLGREVRTLVRGYQAAGPHEVSVSSDGLPAGTYLYCFDGGAQCGQMTLIP